MKKYKYNGETTHLGRHGLVKKGQAILLNEQEAHTIARSDTKEFVPLRESRPEGFPEEPGFPPKGNHFDLSSLRWKTGYIFRDVHRLRRVKLLQAVSQLEASGFPVPKVDYRTDQEYLRDIILTIGRFADWI